MPGSRVTALALFVPAILAVGGSEAHARRKAVKAPANGGTAASAAATGGQGTFLVKVNVPCIVMVDGIKAGELKAGTLASLGVPAGRHLVAVVSPDGSLRDEETVTLPANESRSLRLELPSEAMDVVADGVTPPRKIHDVSPTYSELARARKLRGVVVLDCVVLADGSVRVDGMLKSVPGLDDAAKAAVTQWRYEPATYQGHPQAVHLVVRVASDISSPASPDAPPHVSAPRPR